MATKELEEMFKKYVSPKFPAKTFNKDSCRNRSGGENGAYAYGSYVAAPIVIYDYSYDGVQLYFHSRMTCCYDDTDIFCHRKATVDGMVVFENKYM